jgi:hypothetical protein
MHELNADASASDRMPVAVRTDYDEFTVHSCAYRKFRKILHGHRSIKHDDARFTRAVADAAGQPAIPIVVQLRDCSQHA